MTDPIKAKIQELCSDVRPNLRKLSDPIITLAVVLRALGTAKANFKFYPSFDKDGHWCFSNFRHMER
jgi:hypothetical protein